ncbi:NepR family anti-sigma factor [Methylocystis sp. JR02]|uniref:NepR family anti-sigma factor n=1 Tax=Methylocystis sp. JR02 TaxID=3046284 RepID=UPI0024BB240E|nr:NepR family anti-sigma factor [Methylocystis sp. JR02]MDJ0449737.1 NepR family anti-sigma factor [Methylocystis sp. JR02]
MRPASKQSAQFKEPIRERGVLLSVQRTIPRDEIGPPQKIMTLPIGGSMAKNNPENVVARVQYGQDQPRAETRHSPGALQPGMAVFAGGLQADDGPRRGSETNVRKNGVTLCSAKITRSPHHVDFGDALGKELRNLYDDLVAQPVPERFLNLLNQLEKNVVSSGLSSSAPGERE